MRDLALGADGVSVRFTPVVFDETGFWKTHWLREAWSEDACVFVRKRLGLDALAAVRSDMLRKLGIKSEEDMEAVGNLLLNAGIQKMQDFLINSVTTNFFNNANARLGVGDSTTAEAASQTALQAATNKLLNAMNATFPSRASQTLTFQSDFTTGQANYAWQEFVIDNGATDHTCLNRKVTSLGTKASGTWTLTGTVAIS